MFTGIITHLGKITKITTGKNNDLLLEISSNSKIKRKLEIGCSIACNGICLTLINKKTNGKNLLLSFQASQETIKKTTLGKWKMNDVINLEMALRMSDELGGHLVSGHIDGKAKIIAIKKIKDSHNITFATTKNLMQFIAVKGSIVLDGVSLTINNVINNQFSINLISHTITNTNFNFAKIGYEVNVEIDLIARYLQHLTKTVLKPL